MLEPYNMKNKYTGADAKQGYINKLSISNDIQSKDSTKYLKCVKNIGDYSEIKVLSKITGKMLLNKKRNEDLKKLCKLDTINELQKHVFYANNQRRVAIGERKKEKDANEGEVLKWHRKHGTTTLPQNNKRCENDKKKQAKYPKLKTKNKKLLYNYRLQTFWVFLIPCQLQFDDYITVVQSQFGKTKLQKQYCDFNLKRHK